MSTIYTQPDYCPVCHDGEWADQDNCDRCEGEGYVCPIDGKPVTLEARMDGSGSEFWLCWCDWRSESI